MSVIARSARLWVSGVASLLALLGPAMGVLGAGVSAASRAPSAAAPAGRLSIPAPGQGSGLKGVSCPSATSCWAVGSYTTVHRAEVSQALHWNGRKWSLIPTPSPGGISFLFDISCTSPASCWAVGHSQTKPGGPGLNLVLHWNGRRWAVVPAPDPGGTANGDSNGLIGIHCASPASCWAVGEYSRGLIPAPTLNQVLHWNGRKWSLVASPDPGGTAANDFSELADIRCTSPASCWAVGDSQASGQADLNQVLHWNGRKWSQVHTPEPGGTASGDFSGLNAVSCASPTSCWAVGGSGSSSGSVFTSLNEVLHWNGRTWLRASSPDPDGTGAGANNFLSDVACTSAANCWAVGAYGSTSSGGEILNQALHWNGRTWSPVPTPNPAGTASGDDNRLHDVRCTSSASCWAVGSSQPNGQPGRNQALHWNGSAWSPG